MKHVPSHLKPSAASVWYQLDLVPEYFSESGKGWNRGSQVHKRRMAPVIPKPLPDPFSVLL